MSEQVFVLRPDTRGALYYGILYTLTIGGSLYLVFLFKENTFFFYLFLFSFWYALFAGVTIVFSQCLLLLPFSLREIVVGPRQLILRRKNGSEKVLTDGFDYQASGKSLLITGLTDERRKVAQVVRMRSLPEKDYDLLIRQLKRLREVARAPSGSSGSKE